MDSFNLSSKTPTSTPTNNGSNLSTGKKGHLSDPRSLALKEGVFCNKVLSGEGGWRKYEACRKIAPMNCFNTYCKREISTAKNNGWNLSTEKKADICNACSVAFKKGAFCYKFHLDESGWRNCEACEKPLHCGCIASVHLYFLLNRGVLCMECENQSNKNMASQSLTVLPRADHLSSESTITFLFEKRLSATDVGAYGRLVVPKKFAEMHFPDISQKPEGQWLPIEDVQGSMLVFRFRLSVPTKGVYILDGVRTWMQTMELNAGDTVTFSRRNPQGTLIMGFRKAPNSKPSNQPISSTGKEKTGEHMDLHSAETGSASDESSTSDETESDEYEMSDAETSEESAEYEMSTDEASEETAEYEMSGDEASKKSAENVDKKTLEAAEVMIAFSLQASHEAAEYIDKNTLEAPQELITLKASDESLEAVHKLLTLTGGVSVGQGDTLATEKKNHPRHRTGCKCIICIQPRKGEREKHDASCICEICEIDRRRLKSFRLTYEKRKANMHP